MNLRDIRVSRHALDRYRSRVGAATRESLRVRAREALDRVVQDGQAIRWATIGLEMPSGEILSFVLSGRRWVVKTVLTPKHKKKGRWRNEEGDD